MLWFLTIVWVVLAVAIGYVWARRFSAGWLVRLLCSVIMISYAIFVPHLLDMWFPNAAADWPSFAHMPAVLAMMFLPVAVAYQLFRRMLRTVPEPVRA